MGKFTALLFLLSTSTFAGQISRITTFVDGQILYSAPLNAEFNQLVNTVNTLDNTNLSSSANIAPSKLSAVIAGSAIGRDSGSGALSANVDGSTIVISGNSLAVAAGGITSTQIAPATILSSNIAPGTIVNSNLSPTFFDNLTLDSNGAGGSVEVAPNGINTFQIANGAVTQSKLGAKNIVISASCGNFSTTSASYVSVTNLSVTLSTTGRPVEIMLVSDGSGSNATLTSGAVGYIQISRNGTSISKQEFGYILTPVSSIHHVDFPGAGTYTYSIQLLNALGSPTTLLWAKLVAFEQ